LKKYFKIVYHEIKRRAKMKKVKYNSILLAMTLIMLVNALPWWWPWS